MKHQGKLEATSSVKILDYSPAHKNAFKSLNEAWIKKYFIMEDADYLSLNNPESYIIHKGGEILVAISDEKVVGVCALICNNDATNKYELAKMAVDPKSQGQGIGFLLGKAIISKAKSLGAERLYLESNTRLTPAISLYEKLGFRKVEGHHSPYERSNIQMELRL